MFTTRQSASAGSRFIYGELIPYPIDFGVAYINHYISLHFNTGWSKGHIKRRMYSRKTGQDVYKVLFEGDKYTRRCELPANLYSTRTDGQVGSWYLER